MTSTAALLLLALCLSGALAHKPVFKEVPLPGFGGSKLKVTFCMQLKEGYTVSDKQHNLDMHNVLRNIIATGKETKMWDGGSGYMTAPQAANMLAMVSVLTKISC